MKRGRNHTVHPILAVNGSGFQLLCNGIVGHLVVRILYCYAQNKSIQHPWWYSSLCILKDLLVFTRKFDFIFLLLV